MFIGFRVADSGAEVPAEPGTLSLSLPFLAAGLLKPSGAAARLRPEVFSWVFYSAN